ncbi:putative Rep protein [Feline stool-associated circular virus]|nr:putative Rep protein [Feline stool-associated circular virus]
MAATNWCGTLHLGDEEFYGESWLNQLLGAGKITYGIGQIESCPETGRRHFQFYIQVGRTQKLAWMRRHISDKAHFEQARGNVQQNIDYCSKQDSRLDGPWEVGIARRQGQTTGLTAATEMIASGAAVCEVAKLYPVVWVRHGKGLVHLRQTLALDADRREFGPDGPELWVLYGPSGSGKSRFAKEHWPDAFWKAPYSQWWDGYGKHETVILDDFKDDSMRLADLQRLIDWYPLWVEVKGGSLPMLATRYVITSNTHPETWYTRADVHKTIWRRVQDFAEKHGRLLRFPPGEAAAEEAAAEPGSADYLGFPDVFNSWNPL